MSERDGLKTAIAGRLIFKDWSVPDPDHEPLHEALHTLRYDRERLTRSQAYHICEAAESFIHFAGHPADTKSILDQLRTLRTVVRKRRSAPPQAQSSGAALRGEDPLRGEVPLRGEEKR